MPVAVQPPKLNIPSIDLSPTAGKTDDELAATLLEALNTVGFLHVLNPGAGLDLPHVRDIFAAGSELFELPLEQKEAVGFDVATGAGYTSMMGQITGAKAHRFRGDLKESFSIGPSTSASLPSLLPSESLVPRIEAFRRACFACGLRLLDLFTIALKTPDDDPKYFRSRHTYHNNESLRLIHYPSFPRATAEDEAAQGKETSWSQLKIGEQDIRAGAHQDFGSATLLFQSPPDEAGKPTAVEGLEIFVAQEDGPAEAPDGSGRKGWWIPAPQPEGLSEGGSILVNVGVSMEIWSGSQFKATWHRVVCPNPPELAAGEVLPGRKSVVFFMIPDHNVMLTPIDKSGRPAVAEGCMSSGDFYNLRMKRSYGKDEMK
ncbi:hypothetical protein BCR39DRAFT_39905 [Naematelia encephala]|uniref:Fe2OG dioxygenase domain-containing protein n=1 Tax=Naematelia encephala TaxID=71784 RepID=A0A1Y2BMJ3_9TREE|nr:hypothetical protein BCR39DRAFT_39905 [Naematelia encephala]